MVFCCCESVEEKPFKLDNFLYEDVIEKGLSLVDFLEKYFESEDFI